MNKSLTDEKKTKLKNQKELNSLRKKMNGSNLVWFESLSEKRQYDLLFEWKFEKYSNKIEKPVVKFIKKRINYNTVEYVKVIDYPPNLKHFINKKRNQNRWSVEKSKYRNTAIDILLNSK